MITEIHLDSDRPTCRVIRGPARETFLSTPLVVAMSILSSARPEDERAVTNDVRWTDLLATHGCAVGRKRQTDLLLGLYPQATRTVRYGSETPREIVVTFPPLMLGLAVTGGRHTRACLMVADPSTQAQWSVTAPTVCLVPFPYGNVYSNTGYICWGGVEHGDVVTLALLERTFFASGFNTDLWRGVSETYQNLQTLAAATPAGTPIARPRMSHSMPQMIASLVRSAG